MKAKGPQPSRKRRFVFVQFGKEGGDMFRKFLSLIMVGMLIRASMSSSSAQKSNNTDKSATLAEKTKTRVSDFGVGAKVVLWLKGGENLKGKIDSISNDDFLLATKEPSPRHIKYVDVTQLQLAKLSYKAAGTPDPAAVKRVVVALGIGKNAELSMAGGKKLHGNIQKIEPDNFTIMDSKKGSTTVAYGDVTRIAPKGFPGWGIAAIATGIGVGVALIIILSIVYGG